METKYKIVFLIWTLVILFMYISYLLCRGGVCLR